MPPKNKNTGEDSRFQSIQTDPRFRLPRKKSIRGEVDSRFKDALTNDERFAKKSQIDKYGRKVKSKNAKEELSRYYNFEEDDGDKSEKPDSETSKPDDSAESESGNESAEVENSEHEKNVKKSKPSMRELMRGEGIDESSSSESDLSDEDDSSDDTSDSEVEEVAKDEYEQVRAAASKIPEGEESKRIAVVNLDWDNVTSTDLMATFSSFVPVNRRIISVKIYPSEFGKKQMELEEMNGPPQELFDNESQEKTKKGSQSKKEYDDDQDYSSSNLRKYQLQRLQYFYAVLECDSVETAAGIYSSCDGTEYESTANFFDLRFIPDEVDFSNDKPRDECYKLPASYQPRNFTTDALQHSKVKLTWDETPKERERLAQKAFTDKDAENEDLKAYLASDSDSDEDEEAVAQRYRALLGEDFAPSAKKGDKADEDAVEITFNPVLEGKQAKLEIVGNGDKPDPNQPNPEDNLSTIEKYRLKEKQRRLRRQENYKARKAAELEAQNQHTDNNKAELELLALDDNIIETNASNTQHPESTTKNSKKLTKRATKKKAQEEAERDFDTADPRFQALFEDPDFAIDSTLPQFKKTKGMERIMGERRKRQHASNDSSEVSQTSKRQKSKNDEMSESAKQLASKILRKSQNT